MLQAATAEGRETPSWKSRAQTPLLGSWLHLLPSRLQQKSASSWRRTVWPLTSHSGRQLIGGEMRNRTKMTRYVRYALKLKKLKMLIIQEHLRRTQSGSTFTETFTCNLLCSASSWDHAACTASVFNLQAGGIRSRTRTTATMQDCGVCLQTGEAANHYEVCRGEHVMCVYLNTRWKQLHSWVIPVELSLIIRFTVVWSFCRMTEEDGVLVCDLFRGLLSYLQLMMWVKQTPEFSLWWCHLTIQGSAAHDVVAALMSFNKRTHSSGSVLHREQPGGQ